MIALAQFQLGQIEQSNNSINQSLGLINNFTEINPQVKGQILNNQGQLQLLQGNLENALIIWEEAETFYNQADDLTGVINTQLNQADVLQRLGFYSRAEDLLKKIETNLVQHSNPLLQIKGLLNIASVLQLQGKNIESELMLKQILCSVSKLPVTQNQLNCLELKNKEENQVLSPRKQLYLSLKNINISTQEESEIWLNLGNILMSLFEENQNIDQILSSQYWEQSMITYENAIKLSNDNLTQIKLLNYQIKLLLENKQISSISELLSKIGKSKDLLTTINPNRDGIYAHIYLAENIIKLLNPISDYELNLPENIVNSLKNDALNLLYQAIDQAKLLQDISSESYGYGILGYWYEKEQDWEKAQENTEYSLKAAQETYSLELLYKWQWQMGRILQQKNQNQKEEDFILYYNLAFDSLKNIREKFLIYNLNNLIPFQELESFYKEYIGILLEDHQPSNENIEQVYEIISTSLISELENHLRDCLYIDENNRDINDLSLEVSLNKKKVVIYPIVLKHKLVMIVSMPNENLEECKIQQAEDQNIKCYSFNYYESAVEQSEIETITDDIMKYLNPRYTKSRLLLPLQKLYNYMNFPEIETDINNYIQSNNLHRNQDDQTSFTLVFVLDKLFRSLPLATLYDGDKYLIEKYNIAYSPIVKLLKSKPEIRQEQNIFIGGLTLARQGFSALPGVNTEIEQITEILSENNISKTIIKNQEFTKQQITDQIINNPFSIIHLGTHGQFSSRSENTFILTYDEKLNSHELKNLIDQRKQNQAIDLLILSACQSASGDEQAILGLAGLTVRLGVQSSLATLWSVNDQFTAEFMLKFYQELIGSNSLTEFKTVTKAEILRKTQLNFLKSKYDHPFYWAPFVLIGNWN